MFAVPFIISGLSLLGINEIYNYFNYKKIVNISQVKQSQEIDSIDKCKWLINYITSMNEVDLKEWIINNIRSKSSNIEICNIDKERISKMLSHNIYNKGLKYLDDLERYTISNVVLEIENKLNIQFQDKIDEKYEYYKFGHNEITSIYKPTIFYSTIYLIKQYAYRIFSNNGFSSNKINSIKYFYRKVNDTNEYTIFIHGLGFGSVPYLNFIMELSKTTNIIIPILPNISNMEFDENMFPDYNAIVNTFTEIIKSVEVTSLNIIGHSFGTIISAVLINNSDFSMFINKKVLVDPVCFVNKYYKIFRYIDNPHDGGKILNKVFNACVYDDIYVRYATQRFLCGLKFWISDMALLENSLIVLSGNDKIVPSHDILETLREHNIPCIISEDAAHGDIFLEEHKDLQSVIIDFVQT